MDFNHERIREEKAITIYSKISNGSFQKLGPTDIDYKVFDKDGRLMSYVEVVPRMKNISVAYPLSISARMLLKLVDKKHNPVVVWACDDGIIYGSVSVLVGEIRFSYLQSGTYDLWVYYERQKGLKYIRYM
jgi:hypothetical protein